MLDADQVDDQLPTGPDPEPYLRAIEEYVEAGYTHVYLRQIGPDQEGVLHLLVGGARTQAGRRRRIEGLGQGRLAPLGR